MDKIREVETEMKIYKVRAFCLKCDGELKFSVIDSSKGTKPPTLYIHYCSVCGNKTSLLDIYPAEKYKEINK